MNVQGLSQRMAGLMGYGVMMIDGYKHELSPIERDLMKANASREKRRELNPYKRKGTVEAERKALALFNAMPDVFTTVDLTEKNKELKIFETTDMSYVPKYFQSLVTKKQKCINFVRYSIYTKVKK